MYISSGSFNQVEFQAQYFGSIFQVLTMIYFEVFSTTGRQHCQNFRKKTIKKTFHLILQTMFGESLLILSIKENILIPWRFKQIGEHSLPQQFSQELRAIICIRHTNIFFGCTWFAIVLSLLPSIGLCLRTGMKN